MKETKMNVTIVGYVRIVSRTRSRISVITLIRHGTVCQITHGIVNLKIKLALYVVL